MKYGTGIMHSLTVMASLYCWAQGSLCQLHIPSKLRTLRIQRYVRYVCILSVKMWNLSPPFPRGYFQPTVLGSR